MRIKLNYANVMSSVAVFAALGGGAYAASKIDSNDIARNAVQSKHVAKDALTNKDVKEPLPIAYAHFVNGAAVPSRSTGVTLLDDNVEGLFCLRTVGNPRQVQVTVDDDGTASTAVASLGNTLCPGATEIEVATGTADGSYLNQDFFILVH